MSLRDGKGWDRTLEGSLPDSRLAGAKRERTAVKVGQMDCDRVFCANCGAPSGVSLPGTVHIFYLCDPCVALYGPPPGAVEVR